jgi:hypothetical protein
MLRGKVRECRRNCACSDASMLLATLDAEMSEFQSMSIIATKPPSFDTSCAFSSALVQKRTLSLAITLDLLRYSPDLAVRIISILRALLKQIKTDKSSKNQNTGVSEIISNSFLPCERLQRFLCLRGGNDRNCEYFKATVLNRFQESSGILIDDELIL